MYIGLTPELDRAARRAAGLLRQAPHARGRGRALDRRGHRPGPAQDLEADGAPTAGPASAGPRSTAARAAPRSSSSSSSTSRCASAPRSRCSRSTRSRRRSCGTAPRSRRTSSSRRSSPARSTSPSATPSPTPAPTSRRSRRKAVRDGDEYVINGQKVFTSRSRATPTTSGSRCAPTRTSRSTRASRSSSSRRTRPASRYEPIKNMGGLDTNVTYYEDVRVPVGNLVGEENQGWNLITNQLNHERVTLCSSGRGGAPARGHDRVGRRTRSWPTARRVIDQEWVQINLARVHAKLEFLRLANWRVAAERDAGRAARTRPTRRRSRCSAPSSTWRRSGCCMEIIGPSAPREVRLARGGAQAAGSRRCYAQHAHPHLRRRHQRDAARPHRDLRPQHARLTPVGRQRTSGLHPQRRAARAPGPGQADPRRPHDAHAPEASSTTARTGSTATRGPSSPRRTCSASRCPRASAASATASSSCAWCSQEQGRTVAPLPLIHTLVSAALPDRRVRHAGADRGAERGRQRRRGPHRRAQRARHAGRRAADDRREVRRRLEAHRREGRTCRRRTSRPGSSCRRASARTSGSSSCWPKGDGHHARAPGDDEPRAAVRGEARRRAGERRGAHR